MAHVSPPPSSDDDLPSWNLKRFYDSPSDPRIQEDVDSYKKLCEKFRQTYHPDISHRKTKDLSNEQLKTAIDAFIEPERSHFKPLRYTGLRYQLDMRDTVAYAFYEKIYHALVTANQKTDFFHGELANLPKDRLKSFMEDATIDKKYKFYVQDLVKQRHHLKDEQTEWGLSEDLKRSNSNSEYYERLISEREFALNGRDTAAFRKYIPMASDHDEKNNIYYFDASTIGDIAANAKDSTLRADAFHSMLDTLSSDRSGFEGHLKDVLLAHEKEQKMRGYATRASSWNATNGIPDELPLQMVDAVHDAQIVPDYFKLKAAMMHKERLDPWDINAPLPFTPAHTYNWAEAKDIIVSAIRKFHPEMGEIAETAFRDRWIDAKPAVGKYPGLGFTESGGNDYPPHILVNWHGSIHDLITLGHEVGHAVAMHVHAKHQKGFMDDTSYIEAELTALMTEQMVFAELRRRAKSPAEKVALQAQYLDNSMYYMRRAYDYKFAEDLHGKFPDEHPVYTAEDIDQKNLASLQKCYDGTVNKLDELAQAWPMLYHQFSTPFYTGDYPIACLAAHQAWDKYEKAVDEGKDSPLPQQFMEMIKKGGVGEGPELMNGMGVDILAPGFWKKGTDIIRRETGTLQAMWEREKPQLETDVAATNSTTGQNSVQQWTSSTTSDHRNWSARNENSGGNTPSGTAIYPYLR